MSFTMLPDWVMKTKDLSQKDKLVYCALLRFQGKGKESWASQDTIGEILSMDKRSVSRSLTALKNKGWITSKFLGFGRTNRYSCMVSETSQYANLSVRQPVTSSTPPCPSLDGHLVTINTPPCPSLVIEQEYTNQPTSEKGSVGRFLGVREEIESRTFGYVFLETDESPMKRVEKVFSRSEWIPVLEEVIDDWVAQQNTKHDIGSIPRILSYRLNKLYDK